ncbi:MAG: cation diffusion facilitator family transporter [Parcubacteria group bacterium]|nr:cation diffusion facilitator family transporter [Parcubacteria group bacterium]
MENHLTDLRKISGFLPVLLALLGNGFITALKFAGFLVSGSSVIFSEAIHSFADTANQALLMIGLKRSVKKPSEDFIYGHGRERFLWALISACGIFFLGAGVNVYRGVEALIHPEKVTIGPLIFVILAVVLIIESFTLLIAWRELKRKSAAADIFKILKEGDPLSLAVVYEDGAAVLGVLIAASSIIAALLTGRLYWDAVGSIIIGVLLGIVAVVLINKNREYLIVKSIPDELKEKIVEIMEGDPAIEKVLDFKSAVLDIGSYRVKCEIEFNGPALMKEIRKNKILKNEYKIIQNDYDEFVKFCVDYADLIPRLMGKRIDEIEKKIKEAVPGVRHVDIEIN